MENCAKDLITKIRSYSAEPADRLLNSPYYCLIIIFTLVGNSCLNYFEFFDRLAFYESPLKCEDPAEYEKEQSMLWSRLITRRYITLIIIIIFSFEVACRLLFIGAFDLLNLPGLYDLMAISGSLTSYIFLAHQRNSWKMLSDTILWLRSWRTIYYVLNYSQLAVDKPRLDIKHHLLVGRLNQEIRQLKLMIQAMKYSYRVARKLPEETFTLPEGEGYESEVRKSNESINSSSLTSKMNKSNSLTREIKKSKSSGHNASPKSSPSGKRLTNNSPVKTKIDTTEKSIGKNQSQDSL